jgi:hypothetical protein
VSTPGKPTTDRILDTAPTNHKDHGNILAILPRGLIIANDSEGHIAVTSCFHAARIVRAVAAHNTPECCMYHARCLLANLLPFPLTLIVISVILQFLIALAKVMLASSAAGTEITKAAFNCGTLRELDITLFMIGFHVHEVASGTRMREGMLLPTPHITQY